MANEKRLIDANALMDKFRAYMVERYDREKCFSEENCKTCDRPCLWWRKANEAPTVEAVEVVRCKDCKHRGSNLCPMETVELYPWFGTKNDAFCSYGERREGE